MGVGQAHAKRGRPSHRRLPDAVRERIVQLSRSTHAGFNDHHLCEKLVEREGLSLTRETLRRLLRCFGVPLAFYGDHSGIFVRNGEHWTVEEQLAGKRSPPSSVGP